ncbi:MAG: STAS domain-containing protein [Actinomycetota bacterium]|nr:STAS domain-containing protein [Actinomycetota bacterium]
MNIEVHHPLPGVTELRVEGEVDLDSGKRLARELEAVVAANGPVVVNLCDCTFLDSSGLSALIRSARRVPEPRHFAVFCRSDGAVRKVLSLTRADTLIDVYPDRAAALAAVAG